MWHNISGDSELLYDIRQQYEIIRHMENTKPEIVKFKQKNGKWKSWVYRYVVLRNGEWVKNNIIGWENAIKFARTQNQLSILEEIRGKKLKVEILNLWTGEIITLQEAEKRAKRFNEAVNSGTT